MLGFIGDIAKSAWDYGKDAIGWAGDTAVDTFSTQDARAPEVNPEDYYFGGSAETRDQTLSDLRTRGADQFSIFQDAAYQDYNKLGQEAKDLGRVSRDAGYSGQFQGQIAQGLSNQANRAISATPETYGNRTTQGNWANATSQIGNFSPSAASTGYASKLANYSGGQVDARLGDSYSALQQYAQQGPGPSAAEAQMRAGLDQNVADQIALARSGRGAGANANAARQAQFQAADIGQRTNADMAALRANEAAAWRSQQLQALSGASGVAGNIESASQGRQGMNLQGLSTGASLFGNQDQARLQAQTAAASQYGNMFGAQADAWQAADATRQNYLSQAIAAQNNAAGQTRAGYSDQLSGMGAAAGWTSQAGQNRVSALQNANAAQMGYENAALGVQGAEAERRSSIARAKLGEDSANSRANQSADQAQDAANAGFLSSGLKAITGGLF